MNPLSPNTPPAALRIVSQTDSLSLVISCWFPGTGSETKVIRPDRVVMMSDPCPVVLYFPAHSSRRPAQGQHGHKVPSTGATASRVASTASSSVGRNSVVTRSISGVRKVMYREIVAWSTSKISDHTSSVMLFRAYPQETTSASLRVNSLGRPMPLFHDALSSSPTRCSSSLSCSALRPDIRSNRNGCSVVRGLDSTSLSIDRRSRCLLADPACRQFVEHFRRASVDTLRGGFA